MPLHRTITLYIGKLNPSNRTSWLRTLKDTTYDPHATTANSSQSGHPTPESSKNFRDPPFIPTPSAPNQTLRQDPESPTLESAVLPTSPTVAMHSMATVHGPTAAADHDPDPATKNHGLPHSRQRSVFPLCTARTQSGSHKAPVSSWGIRGREAGAGA